VTVTLGTGQKISVPVSMAQQMAKNAEAGGYSDVASRIRSEIAAQTGGSSPSGPVASGGGSGTRSSTGAQAIGQTDLSKAISGYDPYWVQKLPEQAQKVVAGWGVDITKPMTYEQAASLGGLPPLSSLRPEVQQSIIEAETRAGLRPSQKELELQQQLAAYRQQLEAERAYWQNQLQAVMARLQEATKAMQPVKIQEPPKLQDITPAEDVKAAQPQEQPREALPKGPGGFVQQLTPLPYLPSVDKLYDLYKQVFGKEDEQAKVYLAGPEFQGILRSGVVPLWMRSDPLWRLYLQRLGVISARLGQQ